MALIKVTAGKTLLEGYVRTPPVGLCELIWNAFDEDATIVTVTIKANALDGVDQVQVEDDGRGMTLERAQKAFSAVGDSYKLPTGTSSEGGRPFHGKYGRGRYAAFSLGNAVSWISTSERVDGGELQAIQVSGQHANLDRFEIEEIQVDQAKPGTRVIINTLTTEALTAFDEVSALRLRILTEFALHLNRHADFKISFLGEQIDPSKVIEARTTLPIESPEGVPGAIELTVIEWAIDNVERRLYLCRGDGSIIEEMAPGVQAVGADFTAYLAWDGFNQNQELLLEGDTNTAAGKVLEAARVALRKHLLESSRRRETETVKRWQDEGVYPYQGEPRTPAERAARDTFKIVAMATSRTVDESKSRSSKALALHLLRETFENDPEALLPILRQFSKLPASRIDELREILEHTTLSQLIAVGREIGNRVEFIQGLNAILFERQIKRRLLERRQLHRVLAHETWIFGEEWSLTGDDERLSEVLKKFLSKLGADVELASAKPIVREDGSIAIPDLVLGRRLETHANHFAHLVVELKRPSHKLDDDDVSQLRSYASAITNDERFDQPNASWSFWLIGNETSKSVDEARHQVDRPDGVVQTSKKYTLIVKTWAEIIGDAEHRLKFVQESLQYESNRDSGLAHMRERYAEYLPSEVVEDAAIHTVDSAS